MSTFPCSKILNYLSLAKASWRDITWRDLREMDWDSCPTALKETFDPTPMTQPKAAIFQLTGDKTVQKPTSKYTANSRIQVQVAWIFHSIKILFFFFPCHYQKHSGQPRGKCHKTGSKEQDWKKKKKQDWLCCWVGTFASDLARTLSSQEEGGGRETWGPGS